MKHPNPACTCGGRCHRDYHPAYWRDQQAAFMRERGSTPAGYVAFYAALGETDGERIQAIYQADLATLTRYVVDARSER